MRHVPQLRRIREERALSLRDLAAMSGVAHDTISQIERGERQARPSTIRKLAEALRVEPAELLEGQGRETQPTQQSWIASRDMENAFQQAFDEGKEWFSSIYGYNEDIAVARLKLLAEDPRETLQVAQLARSKAEEIWKGLEYHMRATSEHPAHHYNLVQETPGLRAHIVELHNNAVDATEAWLDFYIECLDRVAENLDKERGVVNAQKAFVRRAYDDSVPGLGGSSPGQKPTPGPTEN
jgi:transcriptional regulator with XRE-family HTH domain